MKTAKVHFNRSATLIEYLRYVWSRPIPARISVENYNFPSPVRVSPNASKLPGQESVPGAYPARPTNLARTARSQSLAARGILGFLLVVLSLLILGTRTAYAQANPCPETHVLKYL